MQHPSNNIDYLQLFIDFKNLLELLCLGYVRLNKVQKLSAPQGIYAILNRKGGE